MIIYSPLGRFTAPNPPTSPATDLPLIVSPAPISDADVFVTGAIVPTIDPAYKTGLPTEYEMQTMDAEKTIQSAFISRAAIAAIAYFLLS